MPSLKQETHRILEGLRVVDLTVMIAGTTFARILAELGADVIHVEPPQGDDGRNSTTRFLGAEGTIFSVGNRSKRGIVIDIRHPEGRSVFERLLSTADVFIENTTPGVLSRFGLGYDKLTATNPKLIQLSISGWGATGPLAGEPGYEVVIQAYSGAYRKVESGAVPVGAGILMGDSTGPLLAGMVMLAALRQRAETGRGTHVTSSVLQGALHQLGMHGALAYSGDAAPAVSANDPSAVVSRFRTQDERWVSIAAKTAAEIQALTQVVGATDNDAVVAWVGERTADEAARSLRAGNVPAVAVRRVSTDLFSEIREKDPNIVNPVDHPTKGKLWMVGSHFDLDGVPLMPRAAAPLLGQHTQEVLLEAGYDAEEIAALEAAGAVLSYASVLETSIS